MHVVERFEASACLAGVAQQLVVGRLADERLLDFARRAPARRAMPPSVTEARVILPEASSVSSAAAETMAKSPCRRANSTKP